MNIIKVGTTYDIADGDVEIFENLPEGVYKVVFSPLAGFRLESVENDLIIDSKIYGDSYKKAAKITKAFSLVNRNLGVLLSGDKGIGKTLFTKLLMSNLMKAGYPVILVQEAYEGIADFLASIKQEVVVVFDEFDKVFSDLDNAGDTDLSEQDQFLTLFDGIYDGKKLFIVTCNKLTGLSDCFINRPGRFHYHIRFSYPSVEDVEVYLKDNVDEKYHSEIEDVKMFALKVDLSYDMLRAIAFELNMGEHFKEVINDLNIINDDSVMYDITVNFVDGTDFTAFCGADLFDEDHVDMRIYDNEHGGRLSFSFDKGAINTVDGVMRVAVKDITFDNDCSDRFSKDTVSEILIVKSAKSLFRYF